MATCPDNLGYVYGHELTPSGLALRQLLERSFQPPSQPAPTLEVVGDADSDPVFLYTSPDPVFGVTVSLADSKFELVEDGLEALAQVTLPFAEACDSQSKQ